MRERGPDDRSPDDWLEGESWTEEPTEAPSPAPPWRRRLDRRSLGRRGGRWAGVALLAALAVLVLGAILVARALGDEDGGGAAEPQVESPPPTVVQTETTPAVEALPEDLRLAPGDRGRPVRRLQRALGELGYEVGQVDGVFGPRTTRALRRFQREAGLEPDGVLGPRTLAALNAALAERS